VTAYVMRTSRGTWPSAVLALRDYTSELTDKERDEREEFVVEGCYLLRDRFLADEVWECLGLPVDECKQVVVPLRDDARSTAAACSPARAADIRRHRLWGRESARPMPTWAIIGFADGDVEGMGLKTRAAPRRSRGAAGEIKRTASGRRDGLSELAGLRAPAGAAV